MSLFWAREEGLEQTSATSCCTFRDLQRVQLGVALLQVGVALLGTLQKVQPGVAQVSGTLQKVQLGVALMGP